MVLLSGKLKAIIWSKRSCKIQLWNMLAFFPFEWCKATLYAPVILCLDLLLWKIAEKCWVLSPCSNSMIQEGRSNWSVSKTAYCLNYGEALVQMHEKKTMTRVSFKEPDNLLNRSEMTRRIGTKANECNWMFFIICSFYLLVLVHILLLNMSWRLHF